MSKKGRPAKYLTVEKWEGFLNNHWKHMNWKVNGLLAIVGISITLLVSILCTMLTVIAGG